MHTTSQEQRQKGILYGSIVAVFVVSDIVTKYIVESTMDLYRPIPVLGDFVRLTFIYNRGAAFGLSLGPFSRYIFLALTVAAVVMLYVWFRSTPLHDRLRLVAIAMVTGGAIGNLRWPVFNVADIGVTVGALLLAISLWKEEAEAGRDAG